MALEAGNEQLLAGRQQGNGDISLSITRNRIHPATLVSIVEVPSSLEPLVKRPSVAITLISALCETRSGKPTESC